MSAFSTERLAQVLLAPVISEKRTFVAEKHNQVVFRVARDATKPEIKAAVEAMWSKKDEKIEAMEGYNDDSVMAAGICLAVHYGEPVATYPKASYFQSRITGPKEDQWMGV